MRFATLFLVLAACGGGPSIPGADPDVEIRSRQCTVDAGGFITVNITYDVTLDVGQAFEATVSTGGNGLNPSNSFTCFSWDTTFAGSDDVGCERERADQPATATVEHFFSAGLPDAPTQFSVMVLGSALDQPFSDIMLANASENIVCNVPPSP